MSEAISDREIVRGLLENKAETINYIYDEIGPQVRVIVMKAGGTEDEINDVFQEGIVSVYENIRSGKYTLRENVKFSTYLIQVCKYKWYDIAKGAHRSKNIELEIDFKDDIDIEHEIAQREKYKRLHDLIDSLGGQCKEILIRFYWKNETMEEIGSAMQMLPTSVKNGKYRCMKKLREIANDLK